MLDPETAPAFALVVKVDGVSVPDVIGVSGLSSDDTAIEVKQQTSDGTYVVRQLPGRAKTGEFTVTRGLTHGAPPFRLMRELIGDDFADARTHVSVNIVDDAGDVVRAFEFRGCRISAITAKWPKPGEDRLPTEMITLAPGAD